ncbi:Solute carrier family 35 member F6 [Chlorella vulgaris]
MKATVMVLAIGMLAAGTLNTIVTKLQDNVVVGVDAKGQALRFRHPAFQTAAMFAGEALCLLPFGLRRWYKHATRAAPLSAEEAATRDHRLRRSFFVFFLPAVCDAGATTLLNLGLCFTSASVFQMLRGTLVIFAGLLTILLLHRRLHAHHWLGIVLIGAGAALVGASSLLHAPHHHHQTPPTHGLGAAQHQSVGSGSTEAHRQLSLRSLLLLDRLPVAVAGDSGADGDGGITAPSPLLGNTLVVLAQLLAAACIIVEEKYLVRYRAPVLLAVGLEGFWGLALCCAALPALSLIQGPGGRPLDSFGQAWEDVRSHPRLQWTTAAAVLVTKHLSGAARATIDACRTLFIWLFALRAGWERFHLLQVVGFVVLLSGTSVYNEILRTCLPAADARHRRHRGHRSLAADAGDGLAEPLLLPQQDLSQGGQAAAAAQQQQQQQQQKAGSYGGVRFADSLASRPIAAGRAGSSSRYTMARQVCDHSARGAEPPLPGLGAISLSLSRGSVLGGGEEEAGMLYSESEAGSSVGGSRDPSQHGPPPGGPPHGQQGGCGTQSGGLGAAHGL